MSPALLPVRLFCLFFLPLATTHAAEVAPALPDKAPAMETLELPKVSVKGSPICSFGFALAGIREPVTKKIVRLFITDVTKDSEAERLGLQKGDEILGINGVKVAGMDGVMRPGGQLFDLVVNQPLGRKIQLEVVVHATKEITLKASAL